MLPESQPLKQALVDTVTAIAGLVTCQYGRASGQHPILDTHREVTNFSRMLSAFTARPIVELKQRDKSKIESVLVYGDHAFRDLTM